MLVETLARTFTECQSSLAYVLSFATYAHEPMGSITYSQVLWRLWLSSLEQVSRF